MSHPEPARGAAFRGRVLPVLLNLTLGTAGGAAAHALNLPLAWMIGAMIATTAAAVIGLPLSFSRPLRTGMITILGVMLGSAFVPEILDQVARWSFSLVALALYAVTTTGATMLYFRKVAGYDPITAYFCAVPAKRAPMAEPATTWAAATSSAGGLAAVSPVMCAAALSAMGPRIEAAGSLNRCATK